MPNWIMNKITFHGTNSENKKIFDFIKNDNLDITGQIQYIDFNKIIPMPGYIYRGDVGRNEKKLYGKNNWYDWSIENWGTKWNASMTDLVDDKFLYFQTAWSSPLPIFNKLIEIFNDINMEMIWADEDMGNNIGESIFFDESHEENFYCADIDGNIAWEIYIDLWGKSDCLYIDSHNNWQRKNCEKCKLCY